MGAHRFSGPLLSDGEAADLYVVDGRITFERQRGADTAWVHGREDLPRLLRAGRHVARTRRYLRDYAHEVEPDELPAAVATQARRGDGWVKLVGDWISREEGDLAPSFPPEAFAAAIEAAHAEGAKVTAHCFGPDVLPGLLDAGIDCIEHGTGLDEALIDQMVAQGTALVPTVMQLQNFPLHAAQGRARFPRYAARMDDLYARHRRTLMAAHEAGVPMYAGSDSGGVARHGNLPGEVVALHELGFSRTDAPRRRVVAGARVAGTAWPGGGGRGRLRRLRLRPDP